MLFSNEPATSGAGLLLRLVLPKKPVDRRLFRLACNAMERLPFARKLVPEFPVSVLCRFELPNLGLFTSSMTEVEDLLVEGGKSLLVEGKDDLLAEAKEDLLADGKEDLLL